MHEYSLMENVVQTLTTRIREEKLDDQSVIRSIHLKVGMLEIHSEESFRQAWEMLIQGTPFAKAALELTIVPAEIDCKDCGFQGPCPEDEADGHDALPVAACPKCGRVSPVKGGRGVEPIDMMVESAHA